MTPTAAPGSRRAEGRAKMLPSPVETVAIGANVLLFVALTGLIASLIGGVSAAGIATGATVLLLVSAGVLVVLSMVVDNVRLARTGSHSAARPAEFDMPPDVLSAALGEIQAEAEQFRAEHPESVMDAPPPGEPEEVDLSEYDDLPDLARLAEEHAPGRRRAQAPPAV